MPAEQCIQAVGRYRPLNALRHRKSERFCLYDIRPAVRQRRTLNRTLLKGHATGACLGR